jgi:hypothetical protein
MRPRGVVLRHPRIQGVLQVRAGLENPVGAGEELGPHRLVQPLHLPRRGRRVRRREQVADVVVGADPVEHHRPRATAETAREDLAVVSEDLAGHSMLAQRLREGLADRPCRGAQDDLGADDEPGMVIDPGHDLDLRAIREVDAAHHIHLPQLHRPAALPPAVILPPAPALPRLDQAMADQRPVNR